MSCSFEQTKSSCGATPNNSNQQVIPLLSCKRDLLSYLRGLGVSGLRGNNTESKLLEYELILNRAGLLSLSSQQEENTTICPRHRYDLTTNFQCKRTCSYPLHKGNRVIKRGGRKVNKDISEEIFKLHGVCVPIGEVLCTSCRLQHYKQRTGNVKTLQTASKACETNSSIIVDLIEEIDKENDRDKVEDKAVVVVEEEQETDEKEETEEQEEIWEQEKHFSFSFFSSSEDETEGNISIWDSANEKREILNKTLEHASSGRYSPIKSVLNAEWDNISARQQSYYTRKAKECILSSLSVIAPGQETTLWSSIQNSSLFESGLTSKESATSVDSKTLDTLIIAYNQADNSHLRLQLLSLFVNDFTKEKLNEMLPGLTKWKIDQARKHAADVGVGLPKIPKIIHRIRLDKVKTDHFLDFISRPAYLQDVAFGVRKLKLDSGDTITIPNAIRTLIPARIIKQYRSFCDDTCFDAASDRTLYRILEVCGASQQKSLQGLDYFSCEGAKAFDDLEIILHTLQNNGASSVWVTEMQDKLRASKRYLKGDYMNHISTKEPCSDHCLTFALSHEKLSEYCARKCTHNHSLVCDRCADLRHVLGSIKHILTSSEISINDIQLQQLDYEIAQAVESIEAWKSHILRTVNQELSKQSVLESLSGPEKVIIVMDWAMKFLPERYRESMTDFYGKRGISWHISAVIRRGQEKQFKVECLVHIFTTCTQNWFAVASVLENVLSTIKKDDPNVKEAYLRSDNAGCYHNANLIMSLNQMGKRTGISIQRYDFSDPQAGKDICDRKIATLKSHIHHYVAEKNEVVTAQDMKKALESHGGVKMCRVAVVEANVKKEPSLINWKGISHLNDFKVEKDGVRAWRAYGIGKGKLKQYNKIIVKGLKDTSLQIIEPFPSSVEQISSNTALSEHRTKHAGYSRCEEPGCLQIFQTEKELQDHFDTGKHSKFIEEESVYDSIRKQWAEKVSNVSIPKTIEREHNIVQPHVQPHETDKRNAQALPKGWALRRRKTGKRMPKNVKKYLVDKFNDGVITGQKTNPEHVSREMRLPQRDGDFLFKSSDWLSAKQISSFFSRLARAQRKKAVKTTSGEDEEELSDSRQEEEFSENFNIELNNLRREIYASIDIQHPIMYMCHDLCSLVRLNKLKDTFKVRDLQEICSCFGIIVKSSKRKQPYISSLEEMVSTCTCNSAG